LHQAGDLFELNVKLWCQKVKGYNIHLKQLLMQVFLRKHKKKRILVLC